MGNELTATAEQTIAQRIRQTLRDLFGSRLAATLELRVLEVQQECERRVRDKDDLIDSLRADLSQLKTKLETYEVVLIPLVSPAANLFKPKPDARTFERVTGPEPGSWAWVQSEHYRKEAELAAESEKNGIRIEGGKEVRQPVPGESGG